MATTPALRATPDPGGEPIFPSRRLTVQLLLTSSIIQTVAGNGKTGFSGDGGAASAAELNYPSGLVVDTAGNVFVADQSNNRIRKLTPARDTTH